MIYLSLYFPLPFLANSGLNWELYCRSLSDGSSGSGSTFSPRCLASTCTVLCLSSLSRFNLSALSCSMETLGFPFDDEDLCLLFDFSFSSLCFFFLCFLCCWLEKLLMSVCTVNAAACIIFI